MICRPARRNTTAAFWISDQPEWMERLETAMENNDIKTVKKQLAIEKSSLSVNYTKSPR